MNASEIRIRWGSAGDYTDPDHMSALQANITAELAAQVAELNEARKPRWVNLSSSGTPFLVDAARVDSLHSGYTPNGSEPPSPCVYVRLRGSSDPLVVTDADHDEVRGKLGIDEDWMQTPKPYGGRYVPDSEYAQMTEIVNTARKIVKDDAMLSVSTGNARDNLDRLATLFDSFDYIDIPF